MPRVHAATITVDSDCSLANAIRSANGDSQIGDRNSCETGDSGADTISLGRDVTLREALPSVVTEVTLNGNNHVLRRAADAEEFRLLFIGRPGDLTINDTTLAGGRLSGTAGSDWGGAIAVYTDATLTIARSVFHDNYAGAGGGAIAAQDATVTINNSEFHNNSSSEEAGFGGALSGDARSSGTFTIDGSEFRGNSTHYGGAIVLGGKIKATIIDSAFHDNHAGMDGGAIVAQDATVTINGSEFRNNAASKEAGIGGAVSAAGASTVTISDSIFRDNAAAEGAAANVDSSAAITITRSTFTGNRASKTGGAIGAYGSAAISESSFVSNSAGDAGGALSAYSRSIEIENSTFYANTVTSSEVGLGGAIFLNSTTAALRHLTLHNNEAIYESLHAQNSSTVNMVNSIVSGSSSNDCYLSEDSSFGKNINNWMQDGSCDSDHWGDPMLSTPRGSPAYIPPYIGSPLVDRVPDDGNCLATDQAGTARPLGPACDIGAYEGAIPGPPWGSSWNTLSDCMVTTTAGLNLRYEPEGQEIYVIPSGSALMAAARTDNWFEVQNGGTVGWVHADYVTVSGSCD